MKWEDASQLSSCHYHRCYVISIILHFCQVLALVCVLLYMFFNMLPYHTVVTWSNTVCWFFILIPSWSASDCSVIDRDFAVLLNLPTPLYLSCHQRSCLPRLYIVISMGSLRLLGMGLVQSTQKKAWILQAGNVPARKIQSPSQTLRDSPQSCILATVRCTE